MNENRATNQTREINKNSIEIIKNRFRQKKKTTQNSSQQTHNCFGVGRFIFSKQWKSDLNFEHRWTTLTIIKKLKGFELFTQTNRNIKSI